MLKEYEKGGAFKDYVDKAVKCNGTMPEIECEKVITKEYYKSIKEGLTDVRAYWYGSRRNKYRNQKAVVDGIEFDSIKEARRWNELKLLERAGEISGLQRQVIFELIPAQREPDTVGKRGGVIKGKVIERKVEYIADFVYLDKNGVTVVEDTKGMRTKDYVLKRKMMLWIHGIRIKEV